MRVNRFFVNKPLGEETLTDDVRLVHQIKNVLRLKVSDSVILFNGSDPYDYHYEIREEEKSQILFRLLEKIPVVPSSAKTVLYLSLIKKELFELACLKSVELGVTHIVPLVSSRTVRPYLDINRLKKIITEGVEQSGRNTLPLLFPSIDLAEIVSSLKHVDIDLTNAFALSLQGEDVSHCLGGRESNADLAFIVGPEGGWTTQEEQFFIENRISTLCVSPYTLRAETAALVCIYLSSLMRK